MAKVSVIGAGSWGTALAMLLCGNGHDTVLWSHREEQAEELRRTREHKAKLPGVRLPEGITITSSLEEALEGKDVIVIDDMISSGESMLDVAKQLKDRKARRVIVCTTFGLFTDGLEKFDEYYEKEYIYRVITTNLNYRNPDLLNRPYYLEADMSKYLASIMDILNHDLSVEKVRSTTKKINKLLNRFS